MGRHSDEDGDGVADQAGPPTPVRRPPIEVNPLPRPGELGAALIATGYRYTDPVPDPRHPRITEPGDVAPDVFPEHWGAEPTERDQAAIDSGAAADATGTE